MRILITNERLDQRAGSDGFVRDLARGLQALGHYVIVYGSDQHQRPRFLERDAVFGLAGQVLPLSGDPPAAGTPSPFGPSA